MKVIILSIIMSCCCSLWSVAQQAGVEEFQKQFNDLTQKKTVARESKDYKKAENLVWEMLELFKAQPEWYRNENQYLENSFYYDITCYQALQGKKKPALANFELAYNKGWDNYSHAKGDTDLDCLRKEKKYLEIMGKMGKTSDFISILQQSGAYDRNEKEPVYHGEAENNTHPRFTYMNPNDSNLVRLREYFNLDSIAGSGDEVSKIKNLLLWVHNTVRHDGSSSNPEQRNAIAMVELCKKENRGVNCRMLAQILNECYLAMGFKSRFVTCMPKVMINDCHVINAVYSNTLNKWLWMDPSYNSYVTDENGNLLGIGEVRERLYNGQPLVLNEDANWNNQFKETKEHYLDSYMAKNLYYVSCPFRSEYNAETDYPGKEWSMHISLVPEGFSTNDIKGGGATPYDTNNDLYFWQSPYRK